MTQPTTQYCNVYREKTGEVSFVFLTESPERAATYVYMADGVPMFLLKLEYDPSKPFGQRVTTTEIRQ